MHLIDPIIICLYIAGCIGAGIWFSGRQRDVSDYFVASGAMKGRINSLLVGLSIAATLFSGISFIMLPSVFYAGGTAFVFTLVSFPLAWVVLRFWFLPRYFKGPVNQRPYDIIERRFGPSVRTAASSLYLLFRVGWMAALIYAPTIAILGAWQLADHWFWPMVLIIGASSTIYTVLGGIRGVIFTDALQFVVIATGIMFTIGFILLRLPVSTMEGVEAAAADGLFETLTFSGSFTTMTIWAVLAAAIVANLGSYIGDQMSLQRYLATGNLRESSRSFMVNVVGIMSVFILLALVGIALRVWYATVPDGSLPTNADQVFSFFIATQLPVGITGLLIAAILAATMSSMTSGVNVVAAVITFDFRMRLKRLPVMNQAQQLRFSRKVTLITGVAATLSTGLIGQIGTIFDIVQTLLGAFGAPLFACMVLAALPLRLAPGAMLTALILGGVAGWSIVWTPIVSLWVAPTAFFATIALAILLTPFMPRRQEVVLDQPILNHKQETVAS